MDTLAPRLRLALEACKAVVTTGGDFCYAAINDEFKARGVTNHDLRTLARRGLLLRVDDSRAGHRAYYRLASTA